jgi:hypothetical protein
MVCKPLVCRILYRRPTVSISPGCSTHIVRGHEMMQETIEGSLREAAALLKRAIVCWEDVEDAPMRRPPSQVTASNIEGAKVRQIFAQGHLRQANRLLNDEMERHALFEDGGEDELAMASEFLGESMGLLRDLNYTEYRTDPIGLSVCRTVHEQIEEILSVLEDVFLTDRV